MCVSVPNGVKVPNCYVGEDDRFCPLCKEGELPFIRRSRWIDTCCYHVLAFVDINFNRRMIYIYLVCEQ
jgi:hypothetical protein